MHPSIRTLLCYFFPTTLSGKKEYSTKTSKDIAKPKQIFPGLIEKFVGFFNFVFVFLLSTEAEEEVQHSVFKWFSSGLGGYSSVEECMLSIYNVQSPYLHLNE